MVCGAPGSTDCLYTVPVCLVLPVTTSPMLQIQTNKYNIIDSGSDMELVSTNSRKMEANKKNFAANFMRTTSIACSGEPQVSRVRHGTWHFLIMLYLNTEVGSRGLEGW